VRSPITIIHRFSHGSTLDSVPVPTELLHDVGVSLGAKGVYIMLASKRSGERVDFDAILEDYLQELENAGWVVVTNRRTRRTVELLQRQPDHARIGGYEV